MDEERKPGEKETTSDFGKGKQKRSPKLIIGARQEIWHHKHAKSYECKNVPVLQTKHHRSYLITTYRKSHYL